MNENTGTAFGFNELKDALQAAGYRVELVSSPNGADVEPIALRSATSGISFDVRAGNRLTGTDGVTGLFDVSFTAALMIEGDLSSELLNRWNGSRRFCRLFLNDAFVVLQMDSFVPPAMSASAFQTQINIWV